MLVYWSSGECISIGDFGGTVPPVPLSLRPCALAWRTVIPEVRGFYRCQGRIIRLLVHLCSIKLRYKMSILTIRICGHGCSVVSSVPCVWRVTGSNHTLATMLGKSFTHSCL